MRLAACVFVAMAAGALATCPPAQVFPSPGKRKCGVEKTPTRTNYTIFTSPAETVSDCASFCLSDANCRSMTFNQTNGACLLYSRIAYGLALEPSRDGSTHFYNKKCFYIPDSCSLPPAKEFTLQAGAPGFGFDGTFLYVNDHPDDYGAGYQDPNAFTGFTTTQTEGTLFTIDSKGSLIDTVTGDAAYQLYVPVEPGYIYPEVYFPTPDVFASGNHATQFVPITCALNSTTNALACTSEVGSSFFGCDYRGYSIGWSMGQADESGPEDYDGCNPMTLTAVFPQ